MQYGISAPLSQTSFRGKTSGGCFLRLVAKPILEFWIADRIWEWVSHKDFIEIRRGLRRSSISSSLATDLYWSLSGMQKSCIQHLPLWTYAWSRKDRLLHAKGTENKSSAKVRHRLGLSYFFACSASKGKSERWCVYPASLPDVSLVM